MEIIDKIEMLFLDMVVFFSTYSFFILDNLKLIGVLLVCCIMNCYLNAFIGAAFFCIYEYILKMFLRFVEQCPRSAYTFRTKYVLLSVGNQGVLNGPRPHPHPQRQYQSSLTGETNMETNSCLLFFNDLYGTN